jgi:3-hydroxyisobutyrate dehydrogenase-like beta-hydroxyacid dehydrogenase
MNIETIGFIGTGMMGHPMALRLIDAGYRLMIWNRTPEKASQLINRGAQRASSIDDLARQSQVIISMVADDAALTAIATGEPGLIGSMQENTVAIDMSTVSPSLTRTLAVHYAKKGVHYLQAPVLGSVPQATDGTLLIFAGGDTAAIDRIQPVFDVLAKRTWKFEKTEQAATVKLACNLFIASMINVLGEGLMMMKKADIDGTVLLDILNESALGAPMYQTKGKSLLERTFTPRFMVRHMEKDLSLIRQAARELGVPMPVVGVIHDLFLAAVNKGYGEEDYSAMVKVLEDMAG